MHRLALVFCCLLAGCSRAPESAAGSSRAAKAPQCSTHGLSLKPGPVQSPLPPPVATTRERIVAAAVACDYVALAAIGRQGGNEFKFSFGPDMDVAAFWREREQTGVPVLRRLVMVLNLPPYQDRDVYVWPAASRDGATAEDWAALNGLYPPEQLAAMRSEGLGYTGLRMGIRADGTWQFAVEGD